MRPKILGAALLCLLGSNTHGLAQQSSTVEVILGSLPTKGTSAYQALRKAAGGTVAQTLELTKCEVWNVPRGQLPQFQRAAEGKNISVKVLDQSWNTVLAPMSASTPASASSADVMSATMASKSVASVGIMQNQPPSMVEFALTKGMQSSDKALPPSSIRLPIDSQKSILADRLSLLSLGDRYVWRGVTSDTSEPVTIMWWPNGRMTGSVSHKGMTYVLKDAGNGVQAVVAMYSDKMPDEHAPSKPMRKDDPGLRTDPLFMTGDAGRMRPRPAETPPNARRPTAAESLNAQDAAGVASTAKMMMRDKDRFQVKAINGKPLRPVEITLMVAYTKKAASTYTNIRTDLIDLAVEEANETFRNSGVGHVSLRLVHTHLTDYDEAGTGHFDHVWRMADKGDGFMEEIPRIRDEQKADVVVLIVDDPSGCGLATRVAADAEEAYAVVHHECAATSYSLAHEVGHIIGARHDRTLDQSTGPFPHGHGFVNGKKWRTMMSYKSSCDGCPRLPVWSSPNVTYKGEAVGNADADNARVLREQAERVSRFR